MGNGSSHEGHEGNGHEVRSADTVAGDCICGRDQRFEEQAGERCCGVSFRCGLRGDQEEWQLQACRHVELEVEEEGSHPSKEGHQSIHQGALRLQGQASLQDGEGTCYEEVEGGLELNFQMISTYVKLWWAVSSSLAQPLVQIAFLRSLGCTVRHFHKKKKKKKKVLGFDPPA